MDDQRFLESEWDYCLVLDACRYDVFEDVYDEYLDGNLEKPERRVVDAGVGLPDVHRRPRHRLLLGEPLYQRSGDPAERAEVGRELRLQWTASDHISDIHDVWKTGWDDDLGTVPPESLAEAYRNNLDAVERADRTVLHYMQPHAPYLSRGKGQKLKQIQKGIKRQEEAGRATTTTAAASSSSLSDSVRPKIESRLDDSEFAQKAGLWLELDPKDLVKDGTRVTALKLYEENLRIALESVAELADELDGTVVVTADHGEAFGEEGVWEHHIETHIPPLMEVPWLEVE